MNPTDDAPTDDAPTDEPVSIAEIADFLQQLRGLSRPSPMPPPHSNQPERDPATQRAAFLARKADLLARITAQHSALAPPTTAPTTTTPTTTTPTTTTPTTTTPTTTTPTTARQDGGST